MEKIVIRTRQILKTVLLGFATFQACTCARPELLETKQIIPPPEGAFNLPQDVEVNRSNNNLDVIDFAGRTYLVFRTAPTHFASEETRLYVLSSADEQVWRRELTVDMNTDLREPRFLAYQGKLHLYFAKLGSNPTKFEPGQAQHVVRSSTGAWSKPEAVFAADFIPWRAKEYKGRAMIVGYTGGASIYNGETSSLDVMLLGSDDGFVWNAYAGSNPVVHTGGGSETDVAFTEEGSLIAVMRNEAGDESGFGANICRAESANLMAWKCISDKRKYDSPLTFTIDNQVYLVGRKNLTDSGNYDLEHPIGTIETKRSAYQVSYSLSPKRCSLWKVDSETLKVEEVFELPSKGDTCFPSALFRENNEVVIYNYSSDPDQSGDPTWVEGQLLPTNIYRSVIKF